MRNLICSVAILGTIFLFEVPALAGDIPESLLYDGNALVFFGTVAAYNKDNETITVVPAQKIKGDVKTGAETTYKDTVLVGGDAVFPADGETYLMSYYDENNPLYVYRVTSTDTATLKIKGIKGQGMWERLQEYLNDGKYEEKEAERLALIELSASYNEALLTSASTETATPAPPIPDSTPEPINTRDITDYWPYGLAGAVIAAGFVIYLLKRK